MSINRKIRIAFLYNAGSSHIVSRCEYFLKQGYEVYYFGLSPSYNQVAPDGVRCIDIPYSKLPTRLKHLRWFGAIRTVRHLTQKYQIDILHIMNMVFGITAPFARSKRIVLEHVGSDVLVHTGNYWFLKGLYRFLYRYADAVVQDSRIAQEAGIRSGAPIENNQVIEFGVDFEIFNLDVQRGVARKSLGLTEEQEFVFSPRGSRDVYNQDIVIKTIPLVRRHFPEVKYVFCGDQEDKYKQLIEQLNIKENVIFAGFLDNGKEMPFFHMDADVVASVPSSDSSPMTVYEAMACGTPVIISELPWYHQKFKNSCDVVVVPVRDVEQLASSILGILKEEIVVDTSSAYNIVFNNINLEAENQKLEALYQRILGE